MTQDAMAQQITDLLRDSGRVIALFVVEEKSGKTQYQYRGQNDTDIDLDLRAPKKVGKYLCHLPRMSEQYFIDQKRHQHRDGE